MWKSLLAVALLACGASSEGEAPPQPPQPPAPVDAAGSIELDSVRLVLEECRLRYTSGQGAGAAELGLKPPCAFSRDRDGQPRIVRTERGPMVAVESSRPAPAPGEGCETLIRGVLVEGGRVYLSEQTQSVAQCLPAVWDELMFHAFAAEMAPLP
jgi:hypothetical protein